MDKFGFSKIMDITPRKRAHVVAMLQHTSMSIQKMGEELNSSKSSAGIILKMRENCCDVRAPPIVGVDVGENEKLPLMMIR